MDTLAFLIIFFVLGTFVLHATKAIKGFVTLWSILIIGAVAWHYIAPHLVKEDQSIVDRAVEIHKELKQDVVDDVDTLIKGDHEFANYAIGNIDRIAAKHGFVVHSAPGEEKFNAEREARRVLRDVIEEVGTQIARVLREVLDAIFLPREKAVETQR